MPCGNMGAKRFRKCNLEPAAKIEAFGGVELIREAYAKAIEQQYRFYSYGDAMLIQ